MKYIFRQRIYIILMLGFVVLFSGLTSCTYHHYKGLEKSSTAISIPNIFDSSFQKATYITDLEVFGNELGGITIIKKVEQSNTFHVVFMSQIGLKYFDLEIAIEKDTNWFSINYIMESLNRDFILTALQTDFELLFSKFPSGAQKQFYKHPEKDIREVIILKNGKEVTSYLFENRQVPLISLLKGSSVIASVKILETKANHPTHININHRKARLKIVLKEIEM